MTNPTNWEMKGSWPESPGTEVATVSCLGRSGGAELVWLLWLLVVMLLWWWFQIVFFLVFVLSFSPRSLGKMNPF